MKSNTLSPAAVLLNDQVKNRLQPGDVEEGLNAASQIGDDMIQRRTQGTVVPDAFTHGSSAQRVRWFKRGLEAGEIGAVRYVQCRAVFEDVDGRMSGSETVGGL